MVQQAIGIGAEQNVHDNSWDISASELERLVASVSNANGVVQITDFIMLIESTLEPHALETDLNV